MDSEEVEMNNRRVDLDETAEFRGQPDDVAIPTEAGGMFRLERMDTGHVWLALYRANGDREVFNISTPRNGRLNIHHSECD